MKTVILCGGLGTRMSEETVVRPKPLVEIGGYPVLWHIMHIYNRFGFRDFVLATGYKGESIKDYFIHYHPRKSDVTVELRTGNVTFENSNVEDWRVRMVDTGEKSQTGGRLLRLKNSLKKEDTFMLTYGDGVGSIDIQKLVEFHKSHGKIATVTAVRPPARFGTMTFDGPRVSDFLEKPQTGDGWINGGFFVFESRIFDYLDNDETVLEKQPLENLARDGQLMAFQHFGFWKCMDTLRDKQSLEEIWQSGSVPWMTGQER